MEQELTNMRAGIQRVEAMRTLVDSLRFENIGIRAENRRLTTICTTLQNTLDRQHVKSVEQPTTALEHNLEVAIEHGREWQVEMVEARAHSRQSRLLASQLEDTIQRLQDEKDTTDTCVFCLAEQREVFFCLLTPGVLLYLCREDRGGLCQEGGGKH